MCHCTEHCSVSARTSCSKVSSHIKSSRLWENSAYLYVDHPEYSVVGPPITALTCKVLTCETLIHHSNTDECPLSIGRCFGV